MDPLLPHNIPNLPTHTRSMQSTTSDNTGVTIDITEIDADDNTLCTAPPETSATPDLDTEREFLGRINGAEVSRLRNAALLGQGAGGDVYEGHHSRLGRVAVKCSRFGGNLNTEHQFRRFRMEARLWILLRHDNVLEFTGIIERQTEERVYLVSALAVHGSLSSYIKSFPNSDRRGLAEQLSNGLKYLHTMRIIHGDVKASNALVAAGPRVKLADFGLAKMSDTTTSTSLKGAGSVKWLAPEVLYEGGGRSFESDVYAFGITLFEVRRPCVLGSGTRLTIPWSKDPLR